MRAFNRTSFYHEPNLNLEFFEASKSVYYTSCTIIRTNRDKNITSCTYALILFYNVSNPNFHLLTSTYTSFFSIQLNYKDNKIIIILILDWISWKTNCHLKKKKKNLQLYCIVCVRQNSKSNCDLFRHFKLVSYRSQQERGNTNNQNKYTKSNMRLLIMLSTS